MLATAAVLASCSPQAAAPGADVMDREDFVETYVALRLAALESSSEFISESDRKRVLGERGTSGEALLAFVERHGEDVVFMEEVWDDIQKRITEAQDGWTAR